MSTQVQSKEKDLLDILWHHMNRELSLDKETVAYMEAEIGKLPFQEKSYVTAWFKAALGLHDEAVSWFKDAMKGDDEGVIANNYLAYLGRSAHNYEHRLELFRLEKLYATPEIRKIARNAAFCIGNEKLVKKISIKLAAMKDGEEREKIRDEGDYMTGLIADFKKATQLTSSEIESLCDASEAIANKHGVNCIGVNYFISSDDDNAFIIRAQTDDAPTLAKMNMELLELLTSEEYYLRPFTSWFQSTERGSLT